MKFSRSQEDVHNSLFLLNVLFNCKEQAMNYWRSWYRSVLAGIALLAGLGLFSAPAFAQFLASGTTTSGGLSANTDITNQATLAYQISGANQPDINSNSLTFKVDNIVRVVVTEAATVGHTVVVPNATAQVTTFVVTNTGNSPQDYLLTVGNLANTSTHTIGGTTYTDSFDPTGCQAFAETGGGAGYQPASDTDRAIVNLSPVGGSNTRTVYVVCTIPPAPGLTSGDAIVSLTATTYKPNQCVVATGACPIGQIEAATAGAETFSAVDVVFADAAAATTGGNAVPAPAGVDAARDGKHTAFDVYRVANASVTVAKAVVTRCDPINFNANPKAIPGAFVRYSITVTNNVAATASATLTTITDAVNVALLNFDTNLITGSASDCTTSESAGNTFKIECTGIVANGVRPACAAPVYVPSGATVSFATPTVTANLANALPVVGTCNAAAAINTSGNYCAGELKPGETVTISFSAQVK